MYPDKSIIPCQNVESKNENLRSKHRPNENQQPRPFITIIMLRLVNIHQMSNKNCFGEFLVVNRLRLENAPCTLQTLRGTKQKFRSRREL